MSRFAFTPKSGGHGPADLGDMQGDTEGRSIFRTATARKDPEKIRRINALRGFKPHPKRGRAQTAPASRALGTSRTLSHLFLLPDGSSVVTLCIVGMTFLSRLTRIDDISDCRIINTVESDCSAPILL